MKTVVLTNNYADSMVLASELQEWVKFVNGCIKDDIYDNWQTHIKNAKINYQMFYTKRYKNFRRVINKFAKYHDDMNQRTWSELIEFDSKSFGKVIFKGEW